MTIRSSEMLEDPAGAAGVGDFADVSGSAVETFTVSDCSSGMGEDERGGVATSSGAKAGGGRERLRAADGAICDGPFVEDWRFTGAVRWLRPGFAATGGAFTFTRAGRTDFVAGAVEGVFDEAAFRTGSATAGFLA